MLFVREFTVRKHERGLLFKNGDFVRFLCPSTYRFFDPRKRVEVQRYDLSQPAFEHRLLDFLVRSYPDEIESIFLRVETGAQQIAVIYENGRPSTVIGPDRRALFWKGVVHVKAEIVDIATEFAAPLRIAQALAARRAPALDQVLFVREVPESHVGLLYVDGKLVGELAPGAHAFWKFNRAIAVELYDLRVKTLEIGGQEILTKDKVSLRINVNANYRFVDAQRAVKVAKDPLDYLYKEIQFGLRAAVGTRTLDGLLEDKGAIDRVVFEHVRDTFAAIGIEVRDIGVKDVILPGDMKEILAKVVEAEKSAQANVIRRREETNATRSLLNTAKVMEDNPVALRLKELEALEKITDKVGNISVYGGLDSVLTELVRLRI